VADGRFIQQTADTETTFTHDPQGQKLTAVLDVDSGTAFYLSNPFAPITDADDVSFSVEFRVAALDDQASPTSFIGLVTTQHVENFGDGFTLNLSTTEGRLVATASVDNSGAKYEGSEINLALQTDYAAVGTYAATTRQLSLAIYGGPGFAKLIGRSTATLPAGRNLTVNRLGLQNGGARITDSVVGSLTIVVDNLSSPARSPIRLAVGNVSVTEGNTGVGQAIFTITLSAASDQTVTVDYATADESATAGSDYIGRNGTLIFPPGITNQTVAVDVLGDSLVETSETFRLVLSHPANASLSVSNAVATILNDDATTISISDAAVTEGDTGTTNAAFTVALSEPSSLLVTVNYATSDRTAFASSDYVARSGTLAFPPGVTDLQLLISVLGDTVTEGNETYAVVLSSPVNATLQDREGLGTIRDDEATPAITIDDIAVMEGDAGPANAVFTVRLSNPSSLTVTVNYATASGTATPGVDYFSRSGTLTFPPGATNQILAVTVVGDMVSEPDETFVVNLSDPVNATLAKGQGQAQIVNDELPPVISIDDVAVTEGNAGPVNGAFSVRLSRPASETVTVDYATADGTATASTDYVACSGTLTFSPGVTNQIIAVTVMGDLVNEPNEFFFVNLTNPANASLGDSQATGTILNDDGVTVSIRDASVIEGDSGTANIEFQVSLSIAAASLVTVGFATADGTARAGLDYAPKSGTITFMPGVTNQSLIIEVNGDTIDEPNENFLVNLRNPLNATLAVLQATGTILDDDAPAVTITDVTVGEPATGATNAVFTVTLSSATEKAVTVDYTTSDGTATAGPDYLPASGTMHFAPGTTASVITVIVNSDMLDESTETFFVTLSNPVNATLAESQGLGAIVDDDPPPMLSIDDVTVTECDQGTAAAVFTVSLSEPSGQTVTVNFSTSNGSAVAGKDYEATSGTAVFPPGTTNQTVGIPIICDIVDEADSSFQVDLSGPVNAIIRDGHGIGTILDNDPPGISIRDVSVEEGDRGLTNAVFTVRLSSAADQVVTVDYTTVEGTAQAGPDYQTRTGTLSFALGVTNQTITVPVLGDIIPEGDEGFFVLLSNAVNADLYVHIATGTIVDDDLLSITVNDPIVKEGGAGTATNVIFTVVLSGASSQTVTVNYMTADLTATAGTDYVSKTGTLIFPPGTTSLPVAITVIGDAATEANETFALNLSNPANATLADDQGQATILDDDPPSALSIDDVTVTEGNAGPVNAVFVLSLSQPSAQIVSVAFATTTGTATAGIDYLSKTGTVSFAPGVTNQTLAVTVMGDTVHEPDETFFVTLSSPNNATLGKGMGQATIVNDDPQPMISVDDVTVSEGSAGSTNAVFTVHLTQPSSQTVMVDYDTVDGNATAGSDYAPKTGTLIFTPGITAQTVVVAVYGDTTNEPDETFLLNLDHPVNATFADEQGRAIIRNDDGVTVLISNATVIEGNAGVVHAVFTVSLSETSSQTVTVGFATVDGTASAESDYVATTGTLTFPRGLTNQALNVEVKGDVLDEAAETFFVHLNNPVNAVIGGPPGVGTILDDDPPAISINDVTVNAGGGTVVAEFKLALTSAASQIVQVDFATANGNATAGSDYEETSGTMIFPIGLTELSLPIVVKGNTLDETNEVFSVNLTRPRNATLGDSQGVCTILNQLLTNRPPVVVLVAPTNSATFTAPVDLVIAAVASDPDGVVTKVEFLSGTLKLGEVRSEPFGMIRSNVQVGTYSLTAKATDNHGATAVSAPVVVTVQPLPADCAVEVYHNDFQGPVGTEWSSTATDVTPLGTRRFLGQFGNDSPSLALTGLPAHTKVEIAFDLFIIRSWDGNSTPFGPDVWELRVADGQALLETSFSNGARQAYPYPYPAGDFDSCTGSIETNTLGYMVAGAPSDSVYHLAYAFHHSEDAISFLFEGHGLESLDNESWGLDNVVVRVVSEIAPVLYSHPTNQAVAAGSDVVFAVGARSTTPLAYQWQFNGTNLVHETNATLTLSRVQVSQAGEYSVDVSNCAGTVHSEAASLLVLPPNAPPTISPIPDQVVDEDTSSAAIRFIVGDAETPVDRLMVSVSTWDTGLIPEHGIAIEGSGANRTLIVIPARDKSGEGMIMVSVTDEAGCTQAELFEVTVKPVNDPPSFLKGPDQTVDANSGPHTIAGWATAISAGPPDEAGQSLTFVVTNNNTALFSAQPEVSASGTLVFAPARNASGAATVSVVLRDSGGTANGGIDTSPPQTFTVTVNPGSNLPPTVWITRPADLSVFCRDTPVEVEAMATDKEGPIAQLELYVGTKLAVSTTNSTCRSTLTGLDGDYVLTARAADMAGLCSTSAPVNIAVIEPIPCFPGEQCRLASAIVVRAGDPEVDWIQTSLFEIGLRSQVLDGSSLKYAHLTNCALIVWHALGTEETALTGSEVEALRRAFTNGIPLYFIGDSLASAARDLEEPSRSQWQELIHLGPWTGRAAYGNVDFAEDVRTHPILSGRFGEVLSFALTNSVELSYAGPEAVALGQLAGADVLVEFTRPAQAGADEVRAVTQNFPLLGGTEVSSLEERKRLFQNAVYWLLGCANCPTYALFLEGGESADPVSVGSVLTYTNLVLDTGECMGMGIVLTNWLPLGVQFSKAEVSQGYWREEDGVVTWHVGHMTHLSTAELRITVIPQRPGMLTNIACVRGYGEVLDAPNWLTIKTAVEGPPALWLQRVSANKYELGLLGKDAVSYDIEGSTDLRNWIWITNNTGPAWSMELTDPQRFGRRFYRAIEKL
jgi:hypothetical protein